MATITSLLTDSGIPISWGTGTFFNGVVTINVKVDVGTPNPTGPGTQSPINPSWQGAVIFVQRTDINASTPPLAPILDVPIATRTSTSFLVQALDTNGHTVVSDQSSFDWLMIG